MVYMFPASRTWSRYLVLSLFQIILPIYAKLHL